MSLAEVRIVTRGVAAKNDEVWVDGMKLPWVRSYKVEGEIDDARTVTVTIVAQSVRMVDADEEPDVRT